MDFGTFYQLRSGRLVEVADSGDVELAVADSWLIDNDRVRSLDAHYDRFVSGVATLDSVANPHNITHVQIRQLFEAVIDLVPKTGRWFPRVEFHAGLTEPLFLKLREAPAQLGEAVLWTLPETDPRSNPAVKGPDLSLGMQLRRMAQVHGADETALLDANGRLVEGALSSIVWWRGDALNAPDSTSRWLPSVTRDEVIAIAGQLGLEVRESAASPAELDGCEVWILGSMQGIRSVREWLSEDPSLRPGSVKFDSEAKARVEAFQRRLRMLSTKPILNRD